MAEGTLASAVILPEQESLVPSPDPGLKRRQSSSTDHDPENKRRRLSSQNENTDPQSVPDRKLSSPGGAEKSISRGESRAAGRRDEERKRGQRLFGSLLGTLSQSSNSAAQRRRADIERKQQDKLKLQDEEYGEIKRKKREERIAIRRQEQKIYEKELMQTRHANLLAMARFLKTKTEPVLYYKPWQLRPEEEAIIQEQIKDADATVARELEELEAHNAVQEDNRPEDKKEDSSEQAPAPEADAPETQIPSQESSDTVGAETNHDNSTEATKPENEPTIEHNIPVSNHQADVHRGAEDDGGEVVEDNEDTVIY